MAQPVTEVRPTDRTAETPWWRRPPWWLTLLVQAAGVWAAGFCFIIAFLSLPDTGLFGVTNDDATRTGGALAALAFGPCLLAGPLLIGAVRRDPRWLQPAALVAGGASLLLLFGASGG